MIELTEARIEDREKAYNWLFHSDFSDFLMNLEGFTKETIPAYEEFCNEYWDFFFDGTQPENGRCYKIVSSGEKEEIGLYITQHFMLKRELLNLIYGLNRSILPERVLELKP
jgi:hypothetical protein